MRKTKIGTIIFVRETTQFTGLQNQALQRPIKWQKELIIQLKGTIKNTQYDDKTQINDDLMGFIIL